MYQKEIDLLKIEAKNDLEKNIKYQHEAFVQKDRAFEKHGVFTPGNFNSWQCMKKPVSKKDF